MTFKTGGVGIRVGLSSLPPPHADSENSNSIDALPK
jgi:hypothetical protein